MTTTTTSPAPARAPTNGRGRGRPVTDEAAATAIDAACRALRLPTIRDRVDEHVTTAEREQHTYAGFLAELLLAECDDRDTRRQARRVHDAGFPRAKRLEDFDYTANPNINPATINALSTGGWVASGAPLCLIGDSGTGKSHLLIALGTAAAEAGHRVRYVLASRLVIELAEADNDRHLTKVIARYGRVDLLCLDELGYLQLDRRGAPNCSSKSSPNAKKPTLSPSPATSPSPAGPKPSPTPASAPPSSTGSPSAATSSRPAQTATASPKPSPAKQPPDPSPTTAYLWVGPDTTITNRLFGNWRV